MIENFISNLLGGTKHMSPKKSKSSKKNVHKRSKSHKHLSMKSRIKSVKKLKRVLISKYPTFKKQVQSKGGKIRRKAVDRNHPEYYIVVYQPRRLIKKQHGGVTVEQLQQAKTSLKKIPYSPEMIEQQSKLHHTGEIYNIAKGKICPPGKRLTKNKKCVRASYKKSKSTKHKSPKRKSPKRKSPKRKSPKHKSPKHKSPKHK